VKNLTALSIAFLLWVLSSAAQPQKSHMPTPPDSMNPENETTASVPMTSMQRRVDLLGLQKEAEDLARTAQTIPADMASVRKGTLPKDIIQKLRQIEKLSKHLRMQIAQ